MVEFKLFLHKTPENKNFERVHAILLTPDGRILLRYKNGEPRVTGGRINADDKSLEAALRREIREEINCEIDRCDYLGYIEAFINEDADSTKTVHENWARMVVRISKIGQPKPDPDRDKHWIYGRTLVPFENAKNEMGVVSKFGQNNLRVLDAAFETARRENYFTEPYNSETEILNLESHD